MSSQRTYATGLRGPEGPAFDRSGTLYVTELDGGSVQRVTPDGAVSEFVRTRGRPNGSAFHRNGDLYVAEAGLGAVFRVPPSGRPYMFADAAEEPFRNPNDLAFDTNGGLYITDPVAGSQDPDGRVYYAHPNGDIALVAEGLRFPNGIALTPDGAELIVAETRTGTLHAYRVEQPGVLGPGRVLAQLEHGAERGGPDGMAFTTDGCLYVAIARMGVICRLDPDGVVTDRLEAGGAFPTNVAFGGADRHTLFITEVETGSVQAMETADTGAALYGELPGTA